MQIFLFALLFCLVYSNIHSQSNGLLSQKTISLDQYPSNPSSNLQNPNQNNYYGDCPIYQYPRCDPGKVLCRDRCCDYGCYYTQDGAILGCSTNGCVVQNSLTQPSCSYGCYQCSQQCSITTCIIQCCNMGQPPYCTNGVGSNELWNGNGAPKMMRIIKLLALMCIFLV